MNKLPVVFLLASACVFAESGDNPLSTAIKNQYNMAKTNLTKAAEKMPEEAYSFQATDAVRSFGQIIGHVADSSYFFCSSALGEKSPNTVDIEKTVTSKAKLVAALNDAMTYCDKAYNSLTDSSAVEKVKFGRNDQPRLAVLTFNNMHDFEHYGNIVTYMRLKNLVPPSSEPRK
jgi:uncharacterized damage-inducible protein DinB